MHPVFTNIAIGVAVILTVTVVGICCIMWGYSFGKYKGYELGYLVGTGKVKGCHPDELKVDLSETFRV